jgi:hypothetical protein
MMTSAAAVALLLLAALMFPPSVHGQETGEDAYEEYVQGTSRVSEFFLALHKEYGEYSRHSQVLRKCGYKKEADETLARVGDLVTKKLKVLVDRDIEGRKLSSMSAIVVARETARGMWIGYGIGFRDSFTTTADLLPARTYESICKASLQKVREWSEEAAK